jgi:hypothetical protein
MKHAKKVLILTSALVLIFIVVSPVFITTADAATVLESPAAATAAIGDSFEIVARGRGGFRVGDLKEFEADYQTRMSLDFTIARRGERGVLLQVLACAFSINGSILSFDDGVGFAGRPQSELSNGTIVFGFRINVTGTSGESGQLELIGRVTRSQTSGPLLFMRGRLVLGESIFVFAQIGRIHRI